MKNIVILISGRGSNMQAIVNANIPNLNISAVISNKEDAPGIAWAKEKNITTQVINHQNFPDRASFDQALQQAIDAYQPDLVVLAGFMRIFTPEFTQHYQGKMINIHPSLLPSFTGLNTHQRAIEMGCKIAGCTVHFVTDKLDYGPIISQAVVPVLPDDTEHVLANRVLQMEHKIYPKAVADFLSDALSIDGMTVKNNTSTIPSQGMIYG